MAEGSDIPNPSRRKALKAAAVVGGGLLVGGAGILAGQEVAKTPVPEDLQKYLTLLPGDFGYNPVLPDKEQKVAIPKVDNDFKKILEMKKDWRAERVFGQKVDRLATLWTQHWMTAKGLYTGNERVDKERFKNNKILIEQQAREVLKYFNEAGKLLEDDSVRKRLTGIARTTNFGDRVPEVPTPEVVASGKPYFSSPFFGAQELANAKATKLVRINLGIHAVISMIEYTYLSNLYSRLTGAYWEGINDVANSHVGWNLARFTTGQKDSRVEELGHDSPGGVFANFETANSLDLRDRFITMQQPFILNMRAVNYPVNIGTKEKPNWVYKMTELSTTDQNGDVTKEGKAILMRYNGTPTWQSRFSEMNKGLQEFCEEYPELGWVMRRSIV